MFSSAGKPNFGLSEVHILLSDCMKCFGAISGPAVGA